MLFSVKAFINVLIALIIDTFLFMRLSGEKY